MRARVVAVALCLIAGNAAAEERQEAVTASMSGVGASIVPGFLIHGSGLWVRGDVETARRLLVVEGIGLGLAAVSGGVLAATGGSRRVSGFTIPMLVSGGGLFLTSWLADIYGSAGGGTRGATPRSALPPLDLELGGFGIYDPVFDYSAFSRAAAALRLGRWRIAPELLVALDDDNQRLRGDVAYRFIGGQDQAGSFLDLIGGLRWHRYGGDGFTSSSGEVVARGRLDLGRLGSSLDGAFAGLSAGLGLEVTDYAMPGVATDVSDMILGGFAFGLYLGDGQSAVHGELALFYDHRRDHLVAGFSPGQQASGFGGYFGAELDLDIGTSPWGLVSRLEWGSAALAGISLRYRLGGER